MKTFTQRLTVRFALLVTGTTALVLVAGGWLLDHQTERGLELLHDLEIHELHELLGDDGKLDAKAIADRISHDADSDAALFVIQVSDRTGHVLFRSDNLGDTIVSRPPGTPANWTTSLPYLGRVHLSAAERGPWLFMIGSPLQPSERLLRDYARIAALLLVVVAALSLLLGYAFSRAALRPVRAIEETARRIRADNLSERIPVPAGRDELASLAQLLNRTFDRLQASFEQIQRFSADASHELKTPLALIRLNAEKLQPRVAADADAAGAVADILEEIARLQQVIDRLLFIARAESGALKLERRPAAPSSLLHDFGDDARALAEDRGVRFALGRNDPGDLPCAPELLRQLFLNVVANALAVSPPGGLVTLDSVALPGAWRFTVTDEGPGLPEPQLARVFERFVRFEGRPAATDSPRGHGLGLAICKGIVELHGGTIRAENRPDRSGLRVIAELPRA